MEQRRATDHEQGEIEAMIAEENDPKIRLQLMVMNRINLSLIANTYTINDIAQKLDDHITNYANHVKREDAILNQGRGAMKVALWVLALAQVAGLAIVGEVRSTINTITEVQAHDMVEHVEIKSRVSVLEKSK